MNSLPTEEQVLGKLRTVIDPEIGRDLVSLDMIRELQVQNSKVSFKLVLTTPACPLKHQITEAARSAVQAIPGVDHVDIDVVAQVKGSLGQTNLPVEGIRNIIAIASGKGGVGKSTVAVNVAVALARTGAQVGLLDADITGPNIPLMMGTSEKPGANQGKMLPVTSYGVKLMSIGFFADNDTPVIWRGTMVTRAIQQFLSEVAWGYLDYLIVDLPPGTGDASLTLAQTIPLTGAVIVTTPQDVALLDARKSLITFKKLSVSILGIVENMAYYVCPNCGDHADIFGDGGGEDASRRLGVAFLGRVPLHKSIRLGGDEGEPVVDAAPESAQAQAFVQLAETVAARVSLLHELNHEPAASAASAS
ncbi:MAG: Mrp/NBP35 family ATP-binding protein [Chloroflexi bacterium]|nr:Mrp/NBP35 family ATP-binding protein [Chloroflexota bacterium]